MMQEKGCGREWLAGFCGWGGGEIDSSVLRGSCVRGLALRGGYGTQPRPSKMIRNRRMG